MNEKIRNITVISEYATDEISISRFDGFTTVNRHNMINMYDSLIETINNEGYDMIVVNATVPLTKSD